MSGFCFNALAEDGDLNKNVRILFYIGERSPFLTKKEFEDLYLKAQKIAKAFYGWDGDVPCYTKHSPAREALASRCARAAAQL
jgi:hypothetical protein